MSAPDFEPTLENLRALQQSFSDQFIAEEIYLRREPDDACVVGRKAFIEYRGEVLCRVATFLPISRLFNHRPIFLFERHISPIRKAVGRTIHRLICKRLGVE
jgi:hypothetical protein